MRLDKFVGRAGYDVCLIIYNWQSTELLFKIESGADYIDLKDDLKKYKVKYYSIKDNVLYIDVKKKEV